jgi:hypothetical protein
VVDRVEEKLLAKMQEVSLEILRHLYPAKTGAESPEVHAGRTRREFFRTGLDDAVIPQA